MQSIELLKINNQLVEYNKQLQELHIKITKGSNKLIDWATKAGEILILVKSTIKHGEFQEWIKQTCNFDIKSAERYMLCHKYSAKTTLMSNLQEAYKLIESEEQKEKEKKQIEQREKIKYREKYGEKPNTWDRADDYAWDKKKKEDEDRTERIENLKTKKTAEQTERENKVESDRKIIDELLNKNKEKITEQQEIISKINMDGKQDSMFNAFTWFLDRLEDDNRRIEACHNMIKFCKKKISILQ